MEATISVTAFQLYSVLYSMESELSVTLLFRFRIAAVTKSDGRIREMEWKQEPSPDR